MFNDNFLQGVFPTLIDGDYFVLMFPGVGEIRMLGEIVGKVYDEKPLTFFDKLFNHETELELRSAGSCWYKDQDFYYIDEHQICRVIKAGSLNLKNL